LGILETPGAYSIPSWPFKLRLFKIDEARELQRKHKGAQPREHRDRWELKPGSAPFSILGCLEGGGVRFANWHKSTTWVTNSLGNLYSFFLF
jgi:hypothetical protein